MNRYEESIADLTKSLEIEPDNTLALRKRGKIYYNMGRYEESHADLNRSLEIESKNAWITVDEEIYHVVVMSRYEEALEKFNKSLKIEPNDTFELRNRGATFRVLGKYEEWL